MGTTPQKKTVTIAPRPLAKVTFTVRYKANNASVKNVQFRGDNTLGPAAERNWPNRGRTNALGKAQVNFWVGNVRVLVREPDGYAAEGLQRWANDKEWAVVQDGPLTEGKHNIDISLVCVAAHANVTVTESVTKKPLPGVKVSAGAFSGLTNGQGKVKSDLLAAGLLHTLTLTRSGHGPVGGTAEGPVTTTVDFRGMTVVKDQDVAAEMRNLWPRIPNSFIKINTSKDFPDWFNNEFAPKYPATHSTLLYPGPTAKNPKGTPAPTFPFRGRVFNALTYKTLFDALPTWRGTDLSIEEFVAIFLIIANETGGTFMPEIERGDLPYVFQYNRGNNRLAGTQLESRGILSDPADVKTWNTTTWPAARKPVPTDAQLMECDFWKFRGRGFIQTTGHTNYIAAPVEKAFTNAGYAGPEAMTSAELDTAVSNDSKVYYPLLKAELGRRAGPFAGTNGQDWRGFGETVAGTTNKRYLDLYEWRCKELYAAMSQAARDGKLQVKP